MSYFIFKGKDSREYGILESLPLDIRAERTTQIINMPAGTPIIYESKAFKAQTVNMTLGLRDNSPDNIREINSWLYGRGKLILSNEPDKYYDAVCNTAIQGTRMVKNLGKIPVNFTVMPYRYAIENEWQEMSISSTWVSYINNDCMCTLQPTIKIYGNGELNFTLKDKGSVTVRNVSEYCIIDVPTRRVYNKDGNIILNETVGNILNIELEPGTNTFYWKANTQKVEIKLNKRWL